MKLREGQENDVMKTQQALHHLRVARDLLAEVGAKRTLERVRAAIKSAEGAERHAQRTVLHLEHVQEERPQDQSHDAAGG